MPTSLPEPAPWNAALPEASPPAGMSISQLPTGTYETRAALAVRGGSFRDKRSFAATAILVQHPKGDLLIDAGFGAGVEEHQQLLPRMARAPLNPTNTVAAQLDAVGYDRGTLLGVLVTHSHWDHVSGLDGLDVPVWMNPAETDYAATDPDGRVYRSLMARHDVQDYDFADVPHLGFARSFDVYGDGSVVAALAGGHTTGSVVVFVTTPGDRRYAFIGDLTWQLDGITRRVERPWLLRRLADSNAADVRTGLLAAVSLSKRMQIVPAHDLRAYDGIPVLAAT